MDLELIGRDDELARLDAVLRQDPGSVAVVGGRAGVGKSHLVRCCAGGARERGWRVDLAVATESAATIPFGALAHLLPLPEPSAQQQLPYLQRALKHLTALDRDAPTLLVVDDAHLLDPASAALLHQLARIRTLKILLTRRTGDPVPDAIGEVAKEADARLRLAPLDRRATRQLVASLLDGPASEPLHAAAWDISRGNPLYLRELLLDAREEDRIELVDQVWVLTEPLQPGERLRELIEDRLRKLAGEDRAALEFLAVGEPLDMDVLREHVEDEAFERLSRRGFVTVRPEDDRRTASLSHPVYREALRTAIPDPRARRIAGDLADALAAAGGRRSGELLRRTAWQLEGGRAVDPDELTEAARWALAGFDLRLAERLARAAGEHGGFEQVLVLAEALSHQLRVEEADRAFEEAAERADEGDERVRVALAHAQHLFFRAGRPDDASALLHGALRTAPADEADRLGATLALFAAVQGDLPTASAAGARILDREDPSPDVLVGTLFVSTLADAMLGRFRRTHEGVQVGLRHTEEVRRDQPLAEDVLRVNDVAAHIYAGQLHRAEALSESGRRRAIEAGALGAVGPWGWTMLEALLLRGRIADARQVATTTLRTLKTHDPLRVRPSLVALSVAVYAMAGEDPPPRLSGEYGSLPAQGDARVVTLSARAGAWARLRSGDTRAAAEAAVQAGDIAERHTQRVWAALSYHDAVRFGHPEGSTQPLTTLADTVEGELIPTLAAHAGALARSDPEMLEEVSRRFETLGADLYAAEASAQAARLYTPTRAAPARRATARARAMAERCPGARTPALRGLGGEELTDRELEVSRLAMEGLGSQEIADRLTLSRRTVDNYLGAAYRKLGISSREELAYTIGAKPSE